MTVMPRPRLVRTAVFATVLVMVAACSDDAPVAGSASGTTAAPTASTSPPTSAPDATAPVTTAPVTTEPVTTVPVTTTTEVALPDLPVPTGILAAMPFQNTQDEPARVLQIEIVNGGSEQMKVVGVQFLWSGFTTEVASRNDTIVPGETIDFPVPFPGATCQGDGTVATMPDVSTASVRLVLADGTERSVPAFDAKRFARHLYLDDCERQNIDAAVAIEWTDLHEVAFEGRTITEGTLRLTRRTSTGAVAVAQIGNSIIFTLDVPSATAGAPLVTLPAGESTASVPVRFLEGRCDAHAMGETSQPFNFVAQIDLGDGELHPYLVMPPDAERVPMRVTMENGCRTLGLLAPLDAGSA